MFQKLYRHLEDISSTTRRQEERSSNSQEWAAKISGQLGEIKDSFEQSRKPVPWRPLAMAGGVVTAALVAVLAMLLVTIRDIHGDTKTALGRSADNRQASFALFTQVKAAHERTGELEAQISRQDSIIQLQTKTIIELKRLNQITAQGMLLMHKEVKEMRKAAAE